LDTVEITWDTGFVRWNNVSSSDQKNLGSNGFYGVLIARYESAEKKWKDFKLLYIGQAFDQTLRERIPQPHDADRCIDSWLKANPNHEKVVMLGVITRKSQDKLTWELVNDTECCLIFSNKPECNVKCKDSYSGREIQVVNLGDFAPLKNSSHCP